jgi:hypothetical protein
MNKYYDLKYENMTKQLAKFIGQTMIMIHSLLLGPAVLPFSLTLNFLSILSC